MIINPKCNLFIRCASTKLELNRFEFYCHGEMVQIVPNVLLSITAYHHRLCWAHQLAHFIDKH